MATRLLIAAAQDLSKEDFVAQFPILGGGPVQRTNGWTWCLRHVSAVSPNQIALDSVIAVSLIAATFDDEWWTLRMASPSGESFCMASFHSLLEPGVGEWCEEEGRPFHRYLTDYYERIACELWPRFSAQDLAKTPVPIAASEFVRRQGDALLEAVSRLGVPHDPKALTHAMKGPFPPEVHDSPIANLPLVMKGLGVDALDPVVERDDAIVGEPPSPQPPSTPAPEPVPEPSAPRDVLLVGEFATYRQATNDDVERASPMAPIFRQLGYTVGDRERFAEAVFGIVPDPEVEPEGVATRDIRNAFRENGFVVLGALHCDGFPGGIVHAFAGPELKTVGVCFQGTFGGGSIYVTRLDDASWLVTKTSRDMSCVPAIATKNECHSPAWFPWPEHRDAVRDAGPDGLGLERVPETLEGVTRWLDMFFAEQDEQATALTKP